VIRFPLIAPRERWTRAQLVDYLSGCVLPAYGGPGWEPLYERNKTIDHCYAKAFAAALEWQPTARLLGLCCSASAPRKVNRRRWWDQLDLGLPGCWETQSAKARFRAAFSAAFAASKPLAEAFASASLSG
jgi:hypothetical protein